VAIVLRAGKMVTVTFCDIVLRAGKLVNVNF
jgi:hypothetical protein